LFKIVSEASVASGVRRITAVTGANLLAMTNSIEATLKSVSSSLKTSENDVLNKVDTLIAKDKANEKEIVALNAEITRLKSADMFSNPTIVGEFEVYTARIDGSTPDALRSMGDDLKASNDNAVAVIAGANGAKATIVAICGKNAIANGIKAGDVVREVAKLAGGGGGGRPDSAMAGAKDISKLDDAINATTDIVKNILG
jgi:alanyl-tRNA synthetase